MNKNNGNMTNRLSFITAAVCVLLPAAASGQELRKEALKGSTAAYAVIYSTGMPESAVWPLGMTLSRNEATIRHTTVEGNGNNINVNDKVPFRFIIAPTTGPADFYWAAAMGLNDGSNADLSEEGPGSSAPRTGCRNYSTSEFPVGSWRLPTQRELLLMWLFRDAINTVYPSGSISAEKHWSATEKDGTNAWYVDFSATAPESKAAAKGSNNFKFRCVRDY